MRKLVLFDIDGTLVLTGGAGLRAMNKALQQVFGHEDGLQGIALAGRTDWAILADAVARVGKPLDDDLLDRLRPRIHRAISRSRSRILAVVRRR